MKRLILSTFVPQVKPKNTSNKGKKISSTSNNNAKAKPNIVASSSLDSTNDSLIHVTLEQEKYLLKGIIERCVFKSLAGSKQFEEIVHKQGGHRKKQGVGYFNVNGDVCEEEPQVKVKWIPKDTSRSTSTSDTTTPRIPIKLMWVPKIKN